MLVNEIDELRVYRVIRSVQLRHAPNVSDEARIPKSPVFDVGDLFAVDRVRPSLIGSDNGPFLQLSNAYGWLFERKHGDAFAIRMPLERGLWAYRVCNETVGLALRAHPTNAFEDEWRFGYSHGVSDVHVKHAEVIYPHDHVVWVDARVTFEGVTYVRVQGTTGWLFTRRGEKKTLVELTDAEEIAEMALGFGGPSGNLTSEIKDLALVQASDLRIVTDGNALSDGKWHVASEVLPLRELRAMARRHKIRESSFNDRTRVISFVKNVGGGETARIDIYYATGTIGVTVRHHHQNGGEFPSRTQSFYPRCGIREAEKIFVSPKDPEIEGRNFYKRRRTRDAPYDAIRAFRHMGVYVEGLGDVGTEDEETKLRGELRGLDIAMEEMKKQRLHLLSCLLDAEFVSRRNGLIKMHRENEMKEAVRLENVIHARGSRWTIVNRMREIHPLFVQSLEMHFQNVAHIVMTEAFTFVSRTNGKCSFFNAPKTVAECFQDDVGGVGTTVPYLSVAADGRFYAVDSHGYATWSSSDPASDAVDSNRFDELALDRHRKIARVAFGEGNSWFVAFQDGRWEAHGVPDRMVDFVHANGSSPVEVSLGQDEAYFVRQSDGEIDFSLPRACATVVRELAGQGYLIKNVVLSPTNTAFGWLIRYE
jgi:hypothetical protein